MRSRPPTLSARSRIAGGERERRRRLGHELRHQLPVEAHLHRRLVDLGAGPAVERARLARQHSATRSPRAR